MAFKKQTKFNEAHARAFYQSTLQQNPLLLGVWGVGELALLSSAWLSGEGLDHALLGVKGLAVLSAGALILSGYSSEKRRGWIGQLFHHYARVMMLFAIASGISGGSRSKCSFVLNFLVTSVTLTLGSPNLKEKQVATMCLMLSQCATLFDKAMAWDERWARIVVEEIPMLGISLLLSALVSLHHTQWQDLWLLSVRRQTLGADAQPLSPSAPQPEAAEFLRTKSTEGKDGNNLILQKMQNFRIIKQIGRGATGFVYQVMEERTGLNFAYKRAKETHFRQSKGGPGALPSTIRDRITEEAAVMQGLKHDNVVRCYGMVKIDGEEGMLLELCSKITVADFIARKPMPQPLVARLTRQLMSGVEYLHVNNISHNDIKPCNLLMKHNVLKIGDFGTACTQQRKVEQIRGTAMYLSPEHVVHSIVSRKSDIWAVGCCVVEMLTNLLPVEFMDTARDTMGSYEVLRLLHEMKEAPVPENLEPVAKDFVRKCLTVDMDKRPSSAEMLHHPFLARMMAPDSEVTAQLDSMIEEVKARSDAATAEKAISRFHYEQTKLRYGTLLDRLEYFLVNLNHRFYFFLPWNQRLFWSSGVSAFVEAEFQRYVEEHHCKQLTTAILPFYTLAGLYTCAIHVGTLCKEERYLLAFLRLSAAAVPASLHYLQYKGRDRLFMLLFRTWATFAWPLLQMTPNFGCTHSLWVILGSTTVFHWIGMSSAFVTVMGGVTVSSRLVLTMKDTEAASDGATPLSLALFSASFSEEKVWHWLSVVVCYILCVYVHLEVSAKLRRMFSIKISRFGLPLSRSATQGDR